MSLAYDKNNKDGLPYEHYKELFSALIPSEVLVRCTNISFDEEKQAFRLKLMNRAVLVYFPGGDVFWEEPHVEVTAFNIVILLYRYLLEGSYAPAGENPITYSDLPWGDVYLRQFTGRCITRFAYAYGFAIDKFKSSMEKLGADPFPKGDAAYRIEFLSGFYLTFILWGADDEFPPNSQILFSDNFPLAFSTEDCAVVGDIAINIIKSTK